MSKTFYGILSEEVHQTVEKAIEEEMAKIVQLEDKELQQKAMDEINMDFAKMIAEQYQKQMAKKNAQMEELKKASLPGQLEMKKEFKESHKDLTNVLEGELKELTMASVPIPDKPKMANLDHQAIKVSHPAWNRWDKILIQVEEEHREGLRVSTDGDEWHNVFALNGFPISREHCGNEKEFSPDGKTIYYYEVNLQWNSGIVKVGLSGGLHADYNFHEFHNFYYLEDGCDHCCLSGTKHDFELPSGAIKPEWKSTQSDNVIGCGILLHSNGKLLIFFTLNGNLKGKPIPIMPSVDRLYPTVRFWCSALEANFGHDLANPFKFDIGKCPELELE